jgi:hypothetical protein
MSKTEKLSALFKEVFPPIYFTAVFGFWKWSTSISELEDALTHPMLPKEDVEPLKARIRHLTIDKEVKDLLK